MGSIARFLCALSLLFFIGSERSYADDAWCELAGQSFEGESNSSQFMRFDRYCRVFSNLTLNYSNSSTDAEYYRIAWVGPAGFDEDTGNYQIRGHFSAGFCNYEVTATLTPYGRGYLDVDLALPAGINNLFCLPVGNQHRYWTYVMM